MNKVVIRKAALADLPEIEILLKDLLAAIDDREGLDLDASARNLRKLLDDVSSHFLVAETNGTVAGFINFTVRQTILHRGPSGLIDELVVAGEYPGRGIGRELVMAASAECRRLGCCEIEVSTEKENARARQFYSRCGFIARGVLLEADL